MAGELNRRQLEEIERAKMNREEDQSCRVALTSFSHRLNHFRDTVQQPLFQRFAERHPAEWTVFWNLCADLERAVGKPVIHRYLGEDVDGSG